jgi:hypothetical protein
VLLKISRTIALVVGIVLPCIETWRRWRILSEWPSWLDDYIAAALLLYAWHAGRDDVTRSRPYLMAAWGYTFGVAYVSFFGQLKYGAGSDPSGMPTAVVVAFKGVGLVLSLTCLALTWRSAATAPRV